MASCAFLGLGVMGYPMAGHLAVAGHNVKVWNRTHSKAQSWAGEYEGQACDSIKAAVHDAEFVMICVGDDPDVYAVVGEALKYMPSGGVLVDHTTASAECARDCYAQARDKGIGFVDAPISGGEAGAVKGQLTKMVNQICIAGLLQALAEGVHFAQKADLDVDEVVQAIGKGAAQSWQMDNRASTMARDEYEFGFAVDWVRKDLGIALRTAKKIGADLTMTKIVDGYYADIQDKGGNRWDTSSLLKRLT